MPDPAPAPARVSLELDHAGRRTLSRELTRLARASVAEVLTRNLAEPAAPAPRIGFTGPPGVGKSTLVGTFIARRAQLGRSIGVLAIDPASPIGGGAVLGDRIRMDDALDGSGVYLRSISSGDTHDGLGNNVADMLLALDSRGFDELLLETVGVGQAEHAVRALVDTLVLLLQPESGDGVQALKAGILELADVVVIAKSDLPGAARAREHLLSTINFSRRAPGAWQVPVLCVSAVSGSGLDLLDAACAEHRAWAATHVAPLVVRARRHRYRLQALLARALPAALDHVLAQGEPPDLAATYRAVLQRLIDG